MSEWIAVEDGLPEPLTDVIVSRTGEASCSRSALFDGKEFRVFSYSTDGKFGIFKYPAHWMPLPEAPK